MIEPQTAVHQQQGASLPTGRIKQFSLVDAGLHCSGLLSVADDYYPAAVKEATRDGAPPLDLVDGLELAEKLKDLGLGIKKEQVDRITVDESWFQNI